MATKTVKIPNINCNHCVHTIESELGELKGVVSAKATLDTKQVEITWEAPADWTAITKVLKEINYPPEED